MSMSYHIRQLVPLGTEDSLLKCLCIDIFDNFFLANVKDR